MRIAVIGAGSWGTAVSWLLGNKGHDIGLWAREQEISEGINAAHRNPIYLPDVIIPESVTASSDIEEALNGAQAVVMVTPSIGVRGTAEAMRSHLGQDTPVIILSKGVENGTLMLMTEVLEDVLGNRTRIAGLSGPNHAEEVSRGIPSATSVAAYEDDVARLFQDVFMTPTFRVYTNPDVVGVELCAASKNVVAVAAGMSDGLGYGDNTKATLMTRGLAEMARLGKRLGANPLTYMGLAGVGDLIATCTSKHSRNRGLGEYVAKGGTVAGYEAETRMVAEGAAACISVGALGDREGVELPITAQVRSILHEGGKLENATEALMGREARDEWHGMGLVED
ncbi:MAG: NAD(P)-dependent glycerol-3-phosphate dehydrogenase [Actinobacteria bacterium HGW-Actinobacteria-9]|jgi:glycerol-3-phosphate dehydrogenase (NAD(P)+)|nr:MAG: NAD(P)-dependent glycerol-3-phosphate dehydrogenase [Actinobacteria bacterium HGW-Actinobacteria-9]